MFTYELASMLECYNKECEWHQTNGVCRRGVITINKEGRCIYAPQKRKHYKVKAKKKKNNKIGWNDTTIKIELSEENREAFEKAINKSNITSCEIVVAPKPKHIEDNIYYMSGGYQPKKSEKEIGDPPKTGSDVKPPNYTIDDEDWMGPWGPRNTDWMR